MPTPLSIKMNPLLYALDKSSPLARQKKETAILSDQQVIRQQLTPNSKAVITLLIWILV